MRTELQHTLEYADYRLHCTTCGCSWARRIPVSDCPGVPTLDTYPSGVLTTKQLKRLRLTVTGEPDTAVWRFRNVPPIYVYSISRINERPLPWKRREVALQTQRHDRCELCLHLYKRDLVGAYRGNRYCRDCAWIVGKRKEKDTKGEEETTERVARWLRTWPDVPGPGLSPQLYPLLQLWHSELAAEVGKWREEFNVKRTTLVLEAVTEVQGEIVERFDRLDSQSQEVRKLEALWKVMAELGVTSTEPSVAITSAVSSVRTYLDGLEAAVNPFQLASLEEDRLLLSWFVVCMSLRHKVFALGLSDTDVGLLKRSHEWAGLMAWYGDATDDARSWLVGS